MKTDLHIAHFRPDGGGIAHYAQQVEAIYRQLGYRPKVYIIDTSTQPKAVVAEILKTDVDLCHFEIGAADSRQLVISRLLHQRVPELPQLVTIHDPGVIVRHPIPIAAADNPNQAIQFGGKVVRKLLGRSVGQLILRRHLAGPHISTLYLRADCAKGPHAYYLPHPTWHEHPPPAPSRTPRVVGFGGFWGSGKGIETLLDAWRIVGNDSSVKLVLGGGTGDPSDPYATTIREHVSSLQQPVELPGFVAKDKLDEFVQGLGVMVLPYWPELPNGASAMAMRAAELAIPIIASDVPSLHDLLGDGGALYVPPKDSERLADAIQKFAANPKPFAIRAVSVQHQIYIDHGWKAVGQCLEKILSQVIGAKP